MTDPFAVTEYDLDDLPDARDAQRNEMFFTRGTHGEPGFADVWIAHAAKRTHARHIDTVDYLARTVRDAYEIERFGFLDFSLAGEPGQKVIALTQESLAKATILPDKEMSDLRTRRLALATLVDQLALEGKPLTSDIRKTLAVALNLEERVRRRKQAAALVYIEAQFIARGATVTAALAEARLKLGVSEGTLYSFRKSPIYQARLKAATTNRSSQHPTAQTETYHASDPWFAGTNVGDRLDHADRIAQRVIYASVEAEPKSKAGKRARLASQKLRWDVLNLLQGADRLGSPPTEIMRVALDHVLGLIDGRANVVPIPLGGVVDRKAFMDMARLEAGWRGRPTLPTLRAAFAETYGNRPDEGSFGARRRSPLYQTALHLLSEWRRRTG
ncbi:hypothetical protein [Mesorhizobium sp. 10J20-29]